MNKEKYMQRCIQIASNGKLYAAPNPLVGAVIVHKNKIIGEGFHIKSGQAHAEVNAINSVKDKQLLAESTIFVSLEPCSHIGKTPPCADLIIKNKIPHVIIGCQDPFSKVAGNGIKKLKEAGILVEVGILEEECLQLIHRFHTFHKYKRPYIILKWAQSADAFIDKKRTKGSPFILSSPLSSLLTHKRRAEVSSILVGTNTAKLDNPSLTVRHWYGNNPVRLVIDKDLKLTKDLKLLDNTQETLIFTSKKNIVEKENIKYISINFNINIIPQILATLYEKNIQSVLVEGGSKLHQSFIQQNLWDEIYIEQTPHILGSGIKAAQISCEYKFIEEVTLGRRYHIYMK